MTEKQPHIVGFPDADQEGYLSGMARTGTGLTRFETTDGNGWYLRPFEGNADELHDQLQAFDNLRHYVDVIQVEAWQVDFRFQAKDGYNFSNRKFPYLLASREVPVTVFDESDQRHRQAAAGLAVRLAQYYATVPQADKDRYRAFLRDISRPDQYSWQEENGVVKPLLIDTGFPARHGTAEDVGIEAFDVYFHLIAEQVGTVDQATLESFITSFGQILRRFIPDFEPRRTKQWFSQMVDSLLEDFTEENTPKEAAQRKDAVIQPLFRLLGLSP